MKRKYRSKGSGIAFLCSHGAVFGTVPASGETSAVDTGHIVAFELILRMRKIKKGLKKFSVFFIIIGRGKFEVLTNNLKLEDKSWNLKLNTVRCLQSFASF
jgi:uncharacterized protein (AIM24 family)